MTEQQSPSLGDGLAPNGELQGWWKRWGRRQEWQDKLHQQVLRKSLDIPDDDMNVQVDKRVDNSKRGVGMGALTAAMLLAGVPPMLLAGYLAWKSLNAPPPAPEVQNKTINTTTNKGFLIELMNGESK